GGNAMPFIPPADDGVVEPLRGVGISEDSMRHTFFQRLLDSGSGLEIHVGNPHGQYAGFGSIPFYTICMRAIDRVVKVIIHWHFYKGENKILRIIAWMQ